MYRDAKLDAIDWVSDELKERYSEAQRQPGFDSHAHTRSLSWWLPICRCFSPSPSSSSLPSSVVDNASSAQKRSKKKNKKSKKKKRDAAVVVENRDEEEQRSREDEKAEKEEQDTESESKPTGQKQEQERKEECAKVETSSGVVPETALASLKAWCKSQEEEWMVAELCPQCAQAKQDGTGEGWCDSLQCAFVRAYDTVDNIMLSMGHFIAQLDGDQSEITAHLMPLYLDANRAVTILLGDMDDMIR